MNKKRVKKKEKKRKTNLKQQITERNATWVRSTKDLVKRQIICNKVFNWIRPAFSLTSTVHSDQICMQIAVQHSITPSASKLQLHE